MKKFLVTAGIVLATATLANAQTSVKHNSTRTVAKAQMTQMNIVETAKSAGMFNTLLQAAVAAGLADTLSNGGPFTVFAPTDDAFAKLPAGTVENLLKPENKQMLVDILKYHVVSGKVMAADVVKLKKATTLQGQSAKIKASKDGKVMVDKANVIKTDVVASNGVIHVIDSVLMPKAKKSKY